MGRKFDVFSGKSIFSPKSINKELMKQLFIGMSDSVKEYGKNLITEHEYRFYVVDQTRGMCYYRDKVITIPSWVILKKTVEYKAWYISHEMAHAYQYIEDGYSDHHGQRFMKKLIEICPPESVHHEIEYKPRNAIAAGIKEPMSDIDKLCGF